MSLKARIEALERRHDVPMLRDLGAVMFGFGQLDADGWTGADAIIITRGAGETDESLKTRVIDAVVARYGTIADILKALAELLPA